jgi:hypothetical protein
VQARDSSTLAESAVVSVSAELDTSGPTAPGVPTVDLSAYLTQTTDHTWTTSTDAGSGIDYYEYSIGTSAGAADVLTWTNIAQVLTYQATGLSLSTGTDYYTSVRAVDVLW